MITTRRFSPSLRLKLQLTMAKAWEALAETYRAQAVVFVRRLGPWLPVDEALDRYLRDVGVPGTMVDTVRARALIALAPELEEAAHPDTDLPVDSAPDSSTMLWRLFRVDHLVGSLRQRAQQAEDTSLQCRLATCAANETIAVTHVRMAIETAEVLGGELAPDEAIMHYVRTHNLPALEAQIIFQRAMARWATTHTASPDPVLAALDNAAVCAREPVRTLKPAEFGLRLRATV
jgi:hypothetical protein